MGKTVLVTDPNEETFPGSIQATGARETSQTMPHKPTLKPKPDTETLENQCTCKEGSIQHNILPLFNQ